MHRKISTTIVNHKKFIAFVLAYSIVSLLTIRDFPTVDKTNDDMWYLDRMVAANENVFSKQSFFLFDDENEKYSQLSFFDLSGLPFLRFGGWSIFTLRLRSFFYGLVALLVFYQFSLKFLNSKTIAVYASALFSFTYGFLYRSHDARTEILVTLVFLIVLRNSYSIVMNQETQIRIGLLLTTVLLPLFCFRFVHPNGILLILIVAGVLGINRPKVFLDFRNYAWVFGVVIVFIVIEVVTKTFIVQSLSSSVYSVGKDRLDQEVLLRWVPIYRVLDFDSVSSILKTVYHIGGLVLKYPFRFIQRIDTANYLAFIDIALVLAGGILGILILARRNLGQQNKFLLSWVGCYFVFFPLVTMSTTDYSIYILPLFVLLNVTIFPQFLESFEQQGQMILRVGVTLQAIFVLFCLFKVKYHDRYYDRLVEIESNLREVVDDSSKVLGAPIYFTLLKSDLNLDYREIHNSLQVSSVDDFISEIDKRKFDYIIIDSFFEQCLSSMDSINTWLFKKMLNDNYEICTNFATNYPSQKGMIIDVKVYRRFRLNGPSPKIDRQVLSKSPNISSIKKKLTLDFRSRHNFYL